MTSGPRRGGRPTKRTPERVALILQVLRSGGTIAAAAGYAEVSARQVYRWAATDVSFRHAIEKAAGDAEVRFTTAVSDAAMGSPAQYDAAGQLIRPEVKPVWQAAAWWLERRRREDYGLRVGVSVNVRDRAKAIADEMGLDVDELIAEAERIVGGDPPGR